MEIIEDYSEDCTILTLIGRLDGYGSKEVEQRINSFFSGKTRYIIFNLSGVPYISSAGIRVFLHFWKIVQKRGGKIFLCNLLPFPREIISMSGMDKIFELSITFEDAIRLYRKSSDQISGKKSDLIIRHEELADEKIRYNHSGNGRSYLKLIGSLTKVLTASLRYEDIYPIRFSDCEYSIGCGALAETMETAYHLLGEMITLHNSIIWLPTDGNSTPDYFIPVNDKGKIMMFSGFNASLHGPFHETFGYLGDKANTITLKEIYSSIFRHARKSRPDYTGIVAITLIGRSDGIKSSAILHPPIPEYAPKNRGTIMDPENIKEWVEIKNDYAYQGDLVVTFGIGVDLNCEVLSKYKEEELSSLYYIHPSNRGSQDMFLHTHGVIFHNYTVNENPDIGIMIKQILESGEFLDMCHLLDDTRIFDVTGAVSYVSEIEIEKQNY